jgi:hypothetical protein
LREGPFKKSGPRFPFRPAAAGLATALDLLAMLAASPATSTPRTHEPGWFASVNPTFTWVGLARRVPVHTSIKFRDGFRLIAGMTRLPCRSIIDGSVEDLSEVTAAP